MPRSRLVARRERQGFSQERLANEIGVSTSTVAHWERGDYVPRPRYRPQLAAALGVNLTELGLILDDIDAETATLATSNGALPEWLTLFAKAEQAASAACVFETMAVPALLQTRGYADAIERLGHRPDSEVERSKRVQTRLARQAVLDRRPEPLHYFAVLDESVLGRQVGDRSIMFDQLGNLLEVTERPHVNIRIVTGAAGMAATFGSFSLLATSSLTPDLACQEWLAGVGYHETPLVVRDHAELFEHLVDVALDTDESANTISKHREQFR
jgi:transcriptional regulator with XRE-family HTH domain